MTIRKLRSEGCVGEGLDDGRFHLNRFFLCHTVG